jgi:hypothetical protein
LDGPLRVAIAGRVKAGKSTLLNALVGASVAATDASECTRVVTTYRDGLAYEVSAARRDGGTVALPFRRDGGGLDIDLDGQEVRELERIDVVWPSRSLRELTLIDTPGLASLQDETSLRTRDFLAFGDSRPSDADAVIYLLSHLHRRDTDFLGSFLDRSVVASSPVNAVVVLSRADEIGAARVDAMASSGRIAARYERDPELRTLCSAVIPVAGLLAATAQTLREDEVAALRTLANGAASDVDRMLLAVGTFLAPAASDLAVELRFRLLDRLGLFGVRLAVDRLRRGPATAPELVRLLLEASGFDRLRRLLLEHFVPQAQVLKARSALLGLRAVARDLGAAGGRLAAEIERVEAGAIEFSLLRALHLVRVGDVALSDDDITAFERVARTVDDPATRLGVAEATSADQLRVAAIAEVQRWRTRASAPLAERAAVEVCETAARACEALYLELA